jgi:hypothetical protein
MTSLQLVVEKDEEGIGGLNCSIFAWRKEFVIRNSQNKQNGVDNIASSSLKYRIEGLVDATDRMIRKERQRFEYKDIEMQASRKEVSLDASLIARISKSIGRNNNSDITTWLCRTSFVVEPWGGSHSSMACLQRRLWYRGYKNGGRVGFVAGQHAVAKNALMPVAAAKEMLVK